ncbi:MAG TPA: sugar ABC transporter substrate-binding protein, partial [Candidatus Enterenecus faecium]|nr:sugar ABC transporter substrate-binding protein [Candidatus Enterenecus faecium]
MRRWKKIGALALATTLSLSLAACGGGNNKSADGTLTMQIWDTAQRDAMQALADAYHEINPDVTIEVQVTSWDE